MSNAKLTALAALLTLTSLSACSLGDNLDNGQMRAAVIKQMWGQLPALEGELNLPNNGYVVIEDDIMLMVRPNGSISVSTNEVVFLQDNNWDDCVECDGTIDMPIEEYILIDG